MSVALARARGFKVDEEAARQRVQATLARFAPAREDLFQNPLGIGIVGGGALGAGYALLGLAAADVPPNATTDAMVHFVIARQLADGRFHSPDPGRMPLEGSDVTATALGIRSLQQYAPGGLKDEVAKRIHRARNWLLSIQPRGTEEKSYQLQGLDWTGADKGEIARRVAALMAEQRSDGGWAQLPTLSSDAYATGQALVALNQVGSISTTSVAYRNAIKFLLKTQFDDGSWLVVSRARGTQPYLESGFPHGTNQFISAAGTAWATSALLLSLDVVTRRKTSRSHERIGVNFVDLRGLTWIPSGGNESLNSMIRFSTANRAGATLSWLMLAPGMRSCGARLNRCSHRSRRSF